MGKTVPPILFVLLCLVPFPFVPLPLPMYMGGLFLSLHLPHRTDSLPPPCTPSPTVHVATATDSTGLPSSACTPSAIILQWPCTTTAHKIQRHCHLRWLQQDLLTLVLVCQLLFLCWLFTSKFLLWKKQPKTICLLCWTVKVYLFWSGKNKKLVFAMFIKHSYIDKCDWFGWWLWQDNAVGLFNSFLWVHIHWNEDISLCSGGQLQPLYGKYCSVLWLCLKCSAS